MLENAFWFTKLLTACKNIGTVYNFSFALIHLVIRLFDIALIWHASFIGKAEENESMSFQLSHMRLPFSLLLR